MLPRPHDLLGSEVFKEEEAGCGVVGRQAETINPGCLWSASRSASRGGVTCNVKHGQTSWREVEAERFHPSLPLCPQVHLLGILLLLPIVLPPGAVVRDVYAGNNPRHIFLGADVHPLPKVARRVALA